MGAAGLKQAELVWRQWTAFCAGLGIDWSAAQNAHINAFLQRIEPRSTSKKTSPVTRVRYWRVLRDFYDHAVRLKMVAANPADAAKPPGTERVASMALSPNMWQALLDGLPSDDAYKARRNRLVLLLMMRAALTVHEIMALSMASSQLLSNSPGEQAVQIEHAGLPLFQPDARPHSQVGSQAGLAPAYLLWVRTARSGRERMLRLDERCSQAMHDWLELRLGDVALAEPSTRLIVGDRNGKGIAANGLYNICREHMSRCLRQGGFLATPEPNTVLDAGQLYHSGPNTLRNTCIALWFNAGVSLAEIQRRCGFKDASVMSRLGAHLASPFPI